jgi:hypothetical protein
MSIKRLSQLSGKVKTRALNRLDSDRYAFLDISQAEPNIGLPDSDNALLISQLDGTRSFTTQPILSGLSFKANTLDSAVNGTHVLALTSDPFDTVDDVVGLISIGSLLDEFIEADTLQSVTARGATTTANITVAQLNADSTTVDGSLRITGQLQDNSFRQLIIFDSADNVLWGS